MLEVGETNDLEKRLQKLELKTFFAGTYDAADVIFSIHSGQGGTEAMDWASMLQRMYQRFFEKKSWPFDLVEETPGDEAGIKSVTYRVHGRYAYGYLKHEAGTHRLVRQSPFNADNLRQTSFALVEVLPIIKDSDVEVKESDLEWQFTHSSGHGGQNVQKVSTAVRLRHIPTGIITTAQSERYQEQNRQIALDILRAKLWTLEEEKRKLEQQRLKGGRTQAAWGTQIRSYVLHPYKMVKDLRTDYETSNTEAILDGELDQMIEAEIKAVV
jgi:peptide chain release factor 2